VSSSFQRVPTEIYRRRADACMFGGRRYIIKKADIQKGHRVLEIGSGWGSFAMEVSSTFLLHLDASFPKSTQLNLFVRLFPGCSSYRMHRRYPHPLNSTSFSRSSSNRESWHDFFHHRPPPRLPFDAQGVGGNFR